MPGLKALQWGLHALLAGLYFILLTTSTAVLIKSLPIENYLYLDYLEDYPVGFKLISLPIVVHSISLIFYIFAVYQNEHILEVILDRTRNNHRRWAFTSVTGSVNFIAMQMIAGIDTPYPIICGSLVYLAILLCFANYHEYLNSLYSYNPPISPHKPASLLSCLLIFLFVKQTLDNVYDHETLKIAMVNCGGLLYLPFVYLLQKVQLKFTATTNHHEVSHDAGHARSSESAQTTKHSPQTSELNLVSDTQQARHYIEDTSDDEKEQHDKESICSEGDEIDIVMRAGSVSRIIQLDADLDRQISQMRTVIYYEFAYSLLHFLALASTTLTVLYITNQHRTLYSI